MYVCSCRGVNDSTIHHSISAGACSIDDVGAACGAGSDCGSCHSTIEAMLALAEVALADYDRSSAA